MKLTTTINPLLLILAAPLTTAFPSMPPPNTLTPGPHAHAPYPHGAPNATLSLPNLTRRKPDKSQKGTCVANAGTDKTKACKVSFKKYDCRNSNCDGEGGAECVIAPNERGRWVAKCPNNELEYEWDWPWTG